MNIVLRGLFLSLIIVGSAMQANAQLKINEACTSNENLILDQDGQSKDWIELYNPSSNPVNLAGLYLTDSKSDTTKWQFVSGSVPANGFVLVFASGKDRPSSIPPHTNFKLSQLGETVRLYSSDKVLIDSLIVPFVSTDLSYGAFPDGSQSRAFFQSPTPGASNNTSVPSGHIIAYRPAISHTTGIYSDEIIVSISSADEGATIRYSLDGSEPTASSSIYTEPMTIDSTTVLNARVFKAGLLPSRVSISNLIFHFDQSIPLVCLSTHPGYFFDNDSGIYVFGPNAEPDYPYYGANFWSDTEIPVNVQWIDEYGVWQFEQKLGVRIHGGSVSRTRPMRSLRLLADDVYGDDKIDHSLFTSKLQPENKRFLLRNSGSDYLKTMFRDGFIHNHFIRNNLHVDAVSYRPVEVYLNGQYWGIHNVREKVDRYYLHYNYGVDDENVDVLEEQDMVMEGNFTAFNSMEAQVLALDLTNDAQFEVADSLFDVLNMADYFVTQTYINNLDWPYNNLKYWRERKVGAKWRYIIFDLDATLGGVSFAPVELDNLERALGSFGDDNRHVVIFRKLLENLSYREYFINRYCDLVNTVLGSESMNASVDKTASLIVEAIPRHYERWSPDDIHWQEEVDVVKDYLHQRPPFAIDHLQEFFGLEKQTHLHLNVYPPSAGQIDLNSISLREFPFSGVYFEDVPIEVDIDANPGFVFSHWETNRDDLNLSATSQQFNPSDGDSLTAVFVGKTTFQELFVHPNPASEELTVSFVIDRRQRVQLQLLGTDGTLKAALADLTLLAGSHQLVVDVPNGLEGLFILSLVTEEKRVSKKLVLLAD